jgi:hypothetical protein
MRAFLEGGALIGVDTTHNSLLETIVIITTFDESAGCLLASVSTFIRLSPSWELLAL